MHTLSNDELIIKVAAKGAELKSIYNVATNLEYMWQAGPEWPKSSPVLFPLVGGLKDDKYEYEDQTYTLGRHGFARDMHFDLVAEDSNSIMLLLKHNPETFTKFPFEFSFYIKYTLHGTRVQLSYIVNNSSGREMYFSLGAHPAFAVPLVQGTSYEDYYLEFQKEENAGRWPLNNEGLIEKSPVDFLKQTALLPLQKDLFIKDAIVLKDLESKEVTLRCQASPHGLTVRFDGFSYLGIWAAPQADFVCIEPWCGIADSVDASGKLMEKEGIQSLRPGESFERSFTIKVF